ncbi:MAG: PorV/PorQ family protein [Elusimicrobia bacterium]|nr:PorV/PorQ family protein [Elusimicrobiota bacterium]
MVKRALIVSSILTLISGLQAEYNINTTADFLNIGVSARSFGMGNASVANSNDIDGIWTNPVSISMLDSPQIGIMHSELYIGTDHNFIGMAFPLKAIGSIGLSLTRISYGDIEGRDKSRQSLNNYSAYDQSINLTLTRAITSKTKAGINLKSVTSHISDEEAKSLVVDLGMSYGFGKNFKIGMTARNIGSGLRYIDRSEKLPFSITLGMMYNIISGFELAMDITRLIYDRENIINIGSEYRLMDGFYLRAGYMNSAYMDGKMGSIITSGVGIKFIGIEIDWAMSPQSELGRMQRLSIKKKF